MKTKGKGEEEDEDEDEDEDDSETYDNSSEDRSDSDSSDNPFSRDSDDDDDDAGVPGRMWRRHIGLQPARRRAPSASAGRGRGRGGAAAAAAGRGGRRVTASAASRYGSSVISAAMAASQEDDTDESRLAQVELLNGPPAPISLAVMSSTAPGRKFLDTFPSRSKWKVNTLIDVNLRDGRDWERAKIVNIVPMTRQPGSFAFDVTFEGRRTDILPNAIFRFSVESTSIDVAYAPGNEARFEISEAEKAKAIERTKSPKAKAPKKKGANANANADASASSEGVESSSDSPPNWTMDNFKPYQLIDVKIGQRWFLGQVIGSRFTLAGDEYADSQQHNTQHMGA